MRRKYLYTALAAVLLIGSAPLAVSSASAVSSQTVAGHPGLSALTPTNHFTAGSEVKLPLYVQNDGTITQGGAAQYEQRVQTARATTLDISAKSNPLKVNTNQYPAGDLRPGRNGPFNLDITIPEGTKPGTYYVTVHAHYKYTAQVHYNPQQPQYTDYQDEQTFRVPVVVKNQAAFSVVRSSTDVQVGGQGAYNVTVKNVGSEAAKNVNARVSSQTHGVTFGSAGQSASTSIPSWKPGQTKTLTYSAAVAGSVNAYNYSTPLSITFADSNGVTRQAHRLVSTFRPKPKQNFSVRTVRSGLRVGRDGNVSVDVTNNGPIPARHAVVHLTTNNVDITPKRREYALGMLLAGDSANVSFPVTVSDNAKAGPRQFSFTVQYTDTRGNTRQSDSLPATVPVASHRDHFSVTPISGPITPGSSKSVTFRVTNNGNSTVSNINAKVYPNNPISASDDQGFTNSLSPGESTNMTFKFSASGSALSKSYPVSIDFQYDTGGETKLSKYYQVPLVVSKSSRSGGLPLTYIGGAIIVVIGLIAGYVYYNRS